MACVCCACGALCWLWWKLDRMFWFIRNRSRCMEVFHKSLQAASLQLQSRLIHSIKSTQLAMHRITNAEILMNDAYAMGDAWCPFHFKVSHASSHKVQSNSSILNFRIMLFECELLNKVTLTNKLTCPSEAVKTSLSRTEFDSSSRVGKAVFNVRDLLVLLPREVFWK